MSTKGKTTDTMAVVLFPGLKIKSSHKRIEQRVGTDVWASHFRSVVSFNQKPVPWPFLFSGCG